jgi:hypothetical protein
MVRLLVTMVATVLLLAAPVLCLAGLVTHSCSECTESVSCAHEGDCAEDPCSESALRPGQAIGDDEAPPLAVLPIQGPGGSAFAWSLPATRPSCAGLAGTPSLPATNPPLRI